MRLNESKKRLSHGKSHVLISALTAFLTSGCVSSATRIGAGDALQRSLYTTTARDTHACSESRSGAEKPSKTSPVRRFGTMQGLVSGDLPEIENKQNHAVGVQQVAFELGSEAQADAGQSFQDDLPGGATAQLVPPMELPPVPVTRSEQSAEYFVALALGEHPKIEAARQRVAAAINVIPQVGALPDPVFKDTFWPITDQSIQTAAGRIANQMSLSQGVPWREKLKTRAAIASREVQMAQAEVERIEAEIVEAVRLAYYEVWFAARAIRIIGETRELVDDLTKVAEARYRSGGTQQDVLRAQLESDRLDDQLVELAKQKKVAQADLAALVQRPASFMPEPTDELGLADVPQQLDVLLASAERCSPELRAIACEVQRDRQQLKLACLQKYPDLQFGLVYGMVNDGRDVLSSVADGQDNIGFTVGTTLPIWRNKINAGAREAAHRRSSSARRLDAERDVLYGKLRRLLAQADALVEQRSIYDDRIIPRTEDMLKLVIADYRGKGSDFLEFVETYRELLMFETQLARIDATLAGTMAQIERTVGCRILR